MSKKNSPSHSIHASNRIKPWIVWGLGCVFYFYEFLLQVSPSVMSNELMRDFGITGHTLGILTGIYFYSYAAMQLPGGLLMDYFGPRRLLTLATTVCAVSTLAFGITDHLVMACIARLMIGFGSAFAVVGTMKLAANWFKPERFAFLTGLMVTIGMLGAMGGEAPLAMLIDAAGWRESMLIMGATGLILALLIFVIIKDTPSQEKHHLEHPTHHPEESLMKSLFNLIKNKQLWLISIYGGLMYMATPVFAGLWGVPFLMIKMHLTKALAANYISLIFIGWAIAGPLWGIYSNRIGMRKPPLYISTVGACLSACIFIYVPTDSTWLIQLTLLTFGLFSAGFLPAFSVAKELCSQHYVATGLSFMNMMNMIGVALAQPVIGYILDFLWTGEMNGTVRAYSLSSYTIALSSLPVGMVISLLLLPFVRETYCTSVADKTDN